MPHTHDELEPRVTGVQKRVRDYGVLIERASPTFREMAKRFRDADQPDPDLDQLAMQLRLVYEECQSKKLLMDISRGAPGMGEGYRLTDPQAAKWEVAGLKPGEQQHMVDAHNAFRGCYRLPRLEYDEQLANSAQSWACSLVATHGAGLMGVGTDAIHSHWAGISENVYRYALATDKASDPSKWCDNAAIGWMQEAVEWYRTKTFKRDTGHFTAMVWPESRQMGTGYVQYQNHQGVVTTVVVCQYSPPGNIPGQEGKVPPRCGGRWEQDVKK